MHGYIPGICTCRRVLRHGFVGSFSVVCGSPGLFLFLGVSKHRDSRFCVTFFFWHSLALIIGFTGRYIGILTSDAGSVLSIAVTAGLYLMVIKLGNRHFERYHELLELVDVGWNGMAFFNGPDLFFTGILCRLSQTDD